MPDALPNYAGAHLRLGIFYDDHPDGQMTPGVAAATELGLPESWGGPSGFVVFVHLEWTGGAKRHKVTGYKAVPATVTEWYGPSGQRKSRQIPFVAEPEALAKLQTNALGRALKAAGYPADTPDLKALMHWRQRKAEVEAIRVGLVAAGGGTAADAALEAAGKPDEDHDPDEPDEAVAAAPAAPVADSREDPPAEPPTTAEATPPEDPELAERRRELADRAEALGVTAEARKWLTDRHGAPHLTGLDGRQLGTFRAWLDSAEQRAAKQAGGAKAAAAPPAPPERPSPGPEGGATPNGAAEAPAGGRAAPSVPDGPPEIRAALEAYIGLPKRWQEDVDARMAQVGVTWDSLTPAQAAQLLDDVIPSAKQF